MNTKLTRSFGIEISESKHFLEALLLEIKNMKEVLYLNKITKCYDETYQFNMYFFSDSYVLYIKENSVVDSSAILGFPISFIYTSYKDCKNIKTFEFKDAVLKI